MPTCTCGAACGGALCSPTRFTRLDQIDFGSTLAEQLGPLADDLRDLKTQFGLRAYEVRIVCVGWTGGLRGRGDPYVKWARAVLPTPKVSDMTALNTSILAAGADEFGNVRVSEISSRYTEDQLNGLGPDGEKPEPGDNIFWEIEFPERPNKPAEKRRFTVRNVPNYEPGALQWVVDLERAREDRTRDGRMRP